MSDQKWRYRIWRLFFHLPDRPYYFVGDLLGITKGWRPLHMRYPEHFGKN